MRISDWSSDVCSSDQAAGEACPYWPGQPMTAHWGMPDPAAVEGSPEQVRKAFAEAFTVLRRRIELLASLPIETLDRKIGRASCRERECQNVWIWVVAVSLKKKHKTKSKRTR